MPFNSGCVNSSQTHFPSVRRLRRKRGVGDLGQGFEHGGLESLEVEFVPREAEVFDNVVNDAARHVARMPCEGDEAVGAEWI